MLNREPITQPSEVGKPCPKTERWLFCCSTCFYPVLMPAVEQNTNGQKFYCDVCMEHQWFMRVTAKTDDGRELNVVYHLHF